MKNCALLILLKAVLATPNLLAQNSFNLNFNKMLSIEMHDLGYLTTPRKSNKSFNIFYNQKLYLNNNLPNLENFDGLYTSKGSELINSILYSYSGKFLSISVEPQMAQFLNKPSSVSFIQKDGPFSVLNDSYLSINHRSNTWVKNFNIGFKYNEMIFGFSNTGQWWGPGIHTSISMTNNSKGFYYYYLKTPKYLKITPKIRAKFKFIVSEKIKNNTESNYFLTAWFFNIKNKNLELGMSKNTVSGGYSDLKWTLKDAFLVRVTKNNEHLWSYISDFYFAYNSKKSGLKAFLTIGYPYDVFFPEINNNSMASIIGIRKYGILNKKELVGGFEYARFLLGHYYTKVPTQNFYDQLQSEYASFFGRRWAAHSGTDSDDFLIYFGFINKLFSVIYGLNFERHGVTYHFPPEVKIEQRFSVGYSIKGLNIYLNYENEYFEHYGFVDSNQNVWNETFETGSIQRTKTILFSLEYKLQ